VFLFSVQKKKTSAHVSRPLEGLIEGLLAKAHTCVRLSGARDPRHVDEDADLGRIGAKRSSCGIENDSLSGSTVRHPLASVMANSILVAFMLFAATWRSARNISSDFRVPQGTNFEALLLVGTHDLQTLSDCFDCSELLDYCKTRGT
jgi:hypothetical protein